MKVQLLKCMACGKEFPDAPDRYVCDVCGIDGILDVVYDYRSITISLEEIDASKNYSLWRLRKMRRWPTAPRLPRLQVG